MSAKIEIALEKLKMPVVGIGKTDILIDGAIINSLLPGESASAEIQPGKHIVQAILNGVVKRMSKEIEPTIDEKSTVKIYGKYNRLRGNLKLQRL